MGILAYRVKRRLLARGWDAVDISVRDWQGVRDKSYQKLVEKPTSLTDTGASALVIRTLMTFRDADMTLAFSVVAHAA